MDGPLGFAVHSAGGKYGAFADGGQDRSFVSIALIDLSGVPVCQDNGNVTAAFSALGIEVGRPEDGGLIAPGTYTVDGHSPASPSGGVLIQRIDAYPDGGVVFVGTAAPGMGTVQLSAVEPARVAGSYAATLTLQDGGTAPISGSFDLTPCH